MDAPMSLGVEASATIQIGGTMKKSKQVAGDDLAALEKRALEAYAEDPHEFMAELIYASEETASKPARASILVGLFTVVVMQCILWAMLPLEPSEAMSIGDILQWNAFMLAIGAMTLMLSVFGIWMEFKANQRRRTYIRYVERVIDRVDGESKQ